MKKTTITLIPFLIASCGNPTVDLRASGKNAQYYERDLYECKRIVKSMPLSFLNLPPENKLFLTDCLEGRGHSIINGG
ncbi:hypothetical protein [Marinobacter sp.]|uniref:hypothetical protein n=1 Tax=Marinobacter sp. TaxID=50741 RepID=UPI00235253DF|nr:hypothetical protein [Marinobacter sp.]